MAALRAGMRRRCECMRIVDDTARLLRAPEVRSPRPRSASTPSATISRTGSRRRARATGRRASALAASRMKPQAVEIGDRRVTVRLEERRHGVGGRSRSAPTAGARSAGPRPGSRPTAGSYLQTALTCNVAPRASACGYLDRNPHAGGPFTLVPLPGKRSSLVWVVEPAEAARLAGPRRCGIGRGRSNGARIRSSAS